MSVIRCLMLGVFSIGVTAPLPVSASAQEDAMVWVIVEVEDLRPRDEDGNYNSFTAIMAYVLHDGTHQAFRQGQIASDGLRHFANEGSFFPLLEEFVSTDPHAGGDVLLIPNLSRQKIQWSNATWLQRIPLFDRFRNRYFSYFLKVCPSDDAFVANEDPHSIEVFDEQGRFPDVSPLFAHETLSLSVRCG